MARRGNRPIVWPRPLYSRGGKASGTRPWRAARDIIDWSLKGRSIFDRERPLAPRTLARILEGLRRFGGEELRPFLVLMERGGGTRGVDEPIPTITTARGCSMGVAEPFILAPDGVFGGNAPHAVDDPLPTITAGRGGGHLIEPFLVPNFGERDGQTPRCHSVGNPLPSVTSHGAGAVVEPFLTSYYGTSTVSSVDVPVPTVTTRDRFALVQPVINGRALDIRFRMLEPKELAAAMGFPADYTFSGNRTDVVRQIGNAVAVQTARWLCLSVLGGAPNPTGQSVLPEEAVA